MTRRRRPTIAALLAATAVAPAACSSPHAPSGGPTTVPPTASTSTAPAPTTTAGASTTAPPGDLPATGTYVDGSASFPHYVLDLTTSTPASVAGTLSFVFQDGRTSQVGTVTGTAGGGRAQLTISPPGTAASATYTTATLVLESCTGYLQYATNASQCTFTRAGASTP